MPWQQKKQRKGFIVADLWVDVENTKRWWEKTKRARNMGACLGI